MRASLFFFLFITTTLLQSQTIAYKFSKDSIENIDNIHRIANHLLKTYKNNNAETFLDNKFRIEIAAKHYENSLTTLDSLRNYYRPTYDKFADVIGMQYESFAKTKIVEKENNTAFKDIYLSVLKNIYNKIDTSVINDVPTFFDTNIKDIRSRFVKELNKHKNKDSISIDDARLLCRSFVSYQVYETVMPLAKRFLREEENKQYIINDSLNINTIENENLSAVLIRPRNIKKPLPTILTFNIYADISYDKSWAKIFASQEYNGIVVNTRGKNRSTSEVEPFEHDAKDAYEIIDWISKQPWSNGKVGMLGGSYLGFSQWAATKTMHPALKTIVPMVSVGVGIDYPMHNGVFSTYTLSWIHYVINNKFTDYQDFMDKKKWDSLEVKLYTGNSSFRSLDTLNGIPNKIFQRWLDHPDYDKFWQRMIPHKKEFSKINIPILTMTGYYDDDQLGALYYFNQHHKYNKKPEHYLLIGPYDHGGAQGYPSKVLNGYEIDSVADIRQIPIATKWFNYILKDSMRPVILKDKINYQVMSTNSWKHAPSLARMNNDTLKFYLNDTHINDYYKLSKAKPLETGFIKQEVNFLDRSNTTTYGTLTKKIVDSVLEKQNGLTFITTPFKKDFEINGSFLGRLNLMINKKDVDLDIKLFEVTQDNKYFALSGYFGRLSYAKNRYKRQLLKPNKKESIPIPNSYFTSKRIKAGSKLLLTISVNKNPDWQINYGTGKDVSDETIKDGKIPLKIKWYNDSYITVPIYKLSP